MMNARRDEPGLGPRLERLTGKNGECCGVEYAELARRIVRNAAFSKALRRNRALADERRLTVVALLRRRREMCACELQAALGVSHATVSHHMAVLHRAEVVASHRRGKWMYYRLVPRRGREVP